MDSEDRIRAPRRWGPSPPPPPGHSWESLMDEALHTAMAGAMAGEVPVGALVLSPEGQVLGRAHNCTLAEHDPSAHAEIMALRQAAQATGNHRLGGCVLVVTLEPCLMCVGAIREARLAGVVYGAADARAGAVESLLEGLNLAPGAVPWSMGGVRGEVCAQMLRDFFACLRLE